MDSVHDLAVLHYSTVACVSHLSNRISDCSLSSLITYCLNKRATNLYLLCLSYLLSQWSQNHLISSVSMLPALYWVASDVVNSTKCSRVCDVVAVFWKHTRDESLTATSSSRRCLWSTRLCCIVMAVCLPWEQDWTDFLDNVRNNSVFFFLLSVRTRSFSGENLTWQTWLLALPFGQKI